MLLHTLTTLTLLVSWAHGVSYDGSQGSWMQYEKWDICPGGKTFLTMTVETRDGNGVLAYMDGGPSSTDYMLVQLVNGKIYMEYQFGQSRDGSAYFNKTDVDVKLNTSTTVSIERVRMAFRVTLGGNKGANYLVPNYGSDLCFGPCSIRVVGNELKYDLSPGNSDLYIGGLPSTIKARAQSRARNLGNPFQGRIYDVYYKNCSDAPTNPGVINKGSAISPSSDACYDETSFGEVCQLGEGGEDCPCFPENYVKRDLVTRYTMDFSDQKTRYFVSEQGLDDRIEGDVLRKIEPTTYVTLGLGGRTYFQFAGESQRDECLGNLDYCFQGYTLSFWLVILDDDLQMRDSTLVDNGGSSSHGIWIYWRNNALHTRLRHPDNGRTWENIAYELYPARVYLQTVAGEAQFINYWYHYAFSWSQSAGLQVYLNGVSVGTTTVYSSSDFAVGVRSSFTFGSRDNSGNTIGVADISFSSQRMSQEQIIGRSGLKHYYFTMNRLNGNRLVVWPSDLVATFNPWGLQAQLVPGVVDMALRLGMDAVTRTEYYIDAGDCSNTCFGQTNDCSFYISFWVRFDEIRNGITVLDTGNTGLTIMISQQNLVALVYSDSTDYPNTVTFRGLQANRWYFVEVDGSPQFVNLWINSQIVNSVDYNPIRMPHQGRDHKLLIGKKNEDSFNSYKSAGMFTIDQLDMLQGGREFLRSIGHIQRGIPPHIFYPMDKMRSNGYIDYFYRNVQHSPNATAPLNSFVLGKDMLALSLNTDAFEIVQGRRNEECFNNIEKCVHGILIRGWFKVDNLGQGAEFLTSGFNGIDMAFRNGQLEVSANTLANKWTVNVPNFEFGEWMFLEVSFHPKYGLAVYRDETKMIDTVTSNRYDPVRTAPQSPDTFRVGPAFSGGEQAVVLVDNLEIWYGDRDYVCSIPEVTCTSGNRYTTYIIDFDAWQGAANGQLQHELLRIPARGQLVTGLYDQALDVRGGSGDKAEVTSILPNTPVNDECLGNLTLCPDGVSISFFVKPKTGFLDRSSNGPIYLLSTGVDGIDVYVKDRKLYAEARNGDQRWNVETMPNFLLEEFWNKIIVMWSPIKGLVLARDEDLYIVDEDRSGSYTADEVDPFIDSKFLIGRSGVKQDYYDEGLIAAFDEMIIKYVYEIPTRITHDSFSFERVNSRNRYLVEHPKFPVYLRNGVQVEEGFVGNTSSLGGTNQYVDLGPHWDSCIDNLELCRSTGVTLSFRLNLKQDSDTTGQMLLSGNAYDVRVVYFNQQPRLQVKLRNSEKEWSMTSASIPSDEWINVDVTWTEDGGAQLYVNNLLNGADEGTRIQQERRKKRQVVTTDSDLPKTNMYVGRAPDSGLRYFNGEIDEINFYRSTRDDLVKKAILDFNCDFYGIVIDMDDIGPNGNIQSSLSTPVMSYNGVETVPGLIGRAIKLEGAQYLDVGNRLSCQSRPNACLNGYTMRVSFKLLQFGQRVYLVSSNPAEIMLTGDDLYVRYSYLMGVWEATLNNVELNQWYSIDLTWDDENGMTVYVNDVQRAWVQKPTRPIDASYDQKNNFYINRPSSDLVTNYNGGMFIIDDLEIWDAKRELLRSCDLLPPVLVKSAVYPETGTGYIRLFYIPEEFKGTGSGSEEMFLKFLASDDDGLLWYNKDGFVGSYVYLQNGDLYFGSDSDEMIPRRITFNRFFGDGQDHTLTIRSDPNNMVTFYVDDESVGQFDPGYKVKFLTEDFNVGGHINVSLATNKEVGQSFVGTIKDVRINGTGYNSDLDLFFEMWKEQFPEFVRASCDMVFDPAIDFECDTGGSSVTFLKNDTFIDGGVWVKKGSKPSIKITFTAAEPRGLLLFTGTEKRRGYGEFFAVEIFDRLLYLVADVGNGVERRKVSPEELKLTNDPHSAEFIFDADERKIKVYYDEERQKQAEVSLPYTRQDNMFEGPLFIGGHDDFSQLPWHIYSEAGFVGCINDLQINTLSSDLRELYQNQGARNIQDNCQAFMDYCGRNPCENSAPCYNHKDRYECDCSGLDHADFENDVCAKLTLIGNINGSEYYDLDLGRMYKTHVNDFSTRFKTTSKDGTMWMTHGQESYIKAFFEEGVLKVALNTGTKSYEWETKGRYNDYEWHTLDVQRRADYMAIFVDGIQQINDTIQSENFYIYMDEIRLGADTPNPGEPPYFFGHMRNFRWPDGTDGTPPFVDERPEPIPTPSITFINTESYMKVPTASGEMEKDLKLKLMIKTKIKDAIFLYQDGIRGQYLAGTINDGRLNIKYNFGNGDKDIEVPGSDLSDDKWHLIELYRKQIDELEVVLDNSERLTVATPIEWPYEFKHSRTLYLGGIPSDIIPPESLKDIGGYMGCMAKVIKSSVLIDLYGLLLDRLRAFGKIERGCQPWNPCDETECQHGCQCDATNSACDNSMIPFTGAMCEERDEGFIFYINGNPGHIHFSYDNPFSPVEDTISFGFKACQPNGLFTKVFGGNEKEFIEIYLIDGNLEAKFQLGGNQPEKITLNGDFTDDWYTVQFKRNGMKATLSLLNDNGDLQQSETASLKTGDDRLDGLERVEIGSEEISTRQYEREYAGIITGFKHSSLNIFDIATGSAGNRVRYDSLGTKPERNPDSFICELSGGCGPDKQICKNYGVCQNNVCNCTLTAYIGRTCEDWPKGRYYGYDRFEAGIDSYRYPRPITTMEDYLAVGVMTDEKDGTIFRVENVDKDQYYHLKLVNGSVRLDYKLKDVEHSIQPTTDTIDSENDVYYVIRMNRTGSTITMTVHNSTAIARKVKTIANLENVPFESQHQIMTGGLMQQSRLDGIYEDAYGIVGGLYYNGLYIYDLSYTPSGDVSNAPDPYELNPRTDARCGICFNDGRSSGNKQCDCTYTSFGGLCCDSKDDLFGFQVKKQGGNAVLIYNSSMSARNVDDLAVSFRTAGGWEDGHIMKVESADKKYYIIIEIKNDKLQVRHKLGPTEQIELFDAVVRQQKDHRVRLHREGNTGYIQLDGSKRNGTQFIDAGIFQPNVIYVGGAYNGTDVTSGHYGIIWKAIFNGVDIVDETISNDGTGKTISVKTKNNDDFAIVPHPWPNLCNKGSPDCDPTPPTYGGGGDIIYEIGPVGPGNPGSVVGLGPSGGTTSPLAFIGAIMGGLLFAAATAFAAVGMKPGFIALSNRFAGGAGKGPYIPVDNGKSSGFPVGNGGGSNYVVAVGMEEYGDGKGVGGGMGGGSQAGSRSQYEDSYTHESRFDATDGSVIGGGGAGTMAGGGAGYNAYNTSSTWYARNETLENQNQAYGGGSTIGGYGNGRAGYAGSVTGGSVAGGSVYGFGTVTNPDQAFITLSEDIAVDNVVLTADGRYVVTGSNLGPPQVWNTMNGEMVTTMRGDHMGSTGLHLAANEQYLIGETMAEQAAVDMNDIQTGNHIPIRRVAVWDFNTGNPLPIAVDQLCTASCVSKDGLKVVMAMTDKFGGGTTIKVLDLLSNKVLHEVTYPDTIGVADSASCVFISPDDRFVAVGFVNSFDNNANFIVFDLFNKSGVVDSPIVALNADPHCTVILRNDEALTGTKNGELVIWSMKTGKAQRQLTSGDTTMLSQGGMPAAHDREVKEVSLSDDGKYLASASADRTVKVWNMESESLIHTLHGHNDEVYTVDIASDNTIIVSGSQDGTIKLWRLRNGNQITSFNATMDIFHARFSKDKKTVVALGDKYGARKLIMLQIVSQKKWRMRSS